MQTKLWFDDEFEALNLMISNSHKSSKELASYLFPHLQKAMHQMEALRSRNLIKAA